MENILFFLFTNAKKNIKKYVYNLETTKSTSIK